MRLIITISIVYIIILIIQGPKYYFFYPTLPLYPNNKSEAKVVAQYSNNRPKYYENFFYLTDDSVSHAFVNLVDESYEQLEKIILSQNYLVLFFKRLYNRARPIQINKNVNLLPSKTANTPAYPAGHAFQASYLAKVLSRKYRNKEKELWKIAEDCNKARIYAGLHYESDGEFSRRLVEKYF